MFIGLCDFGGDSRLVDVKCCSWENCQGERLCSFENDCRFYTDWTIEESDFWSIMWYASQFDYLIGYYPAELVLNALFYVFDLHATGLPPVYADLGIEVHFGSCPTDSELLGEFGDGAWAVLV